MDIIKIILARVRSDIISPFSCNTNVYKLAKLKLFIIHGLMIEPKLSIIN